MVSKPMRRTLTYGSCALFLPLLIPSSSTSLQAGARLVLAVIIHFNRTLLGGVPVDKEHRSRVELVAQLRIGRGARTLAAPSRMSERKWEIGARLLGAAG